MRPFLWPYLGLEIYSSDVSAEPFFDEFQDELADIAHREGDDQPPVALVIGADNLLLNWRSLLFQVRLWIKFQPTFGDFNKDV